METDNMKDAPLERLEEQITELAAHIHAATCRWLELVAEFDRREGWGEWGCKSCAAWLSWRCGLSAAAAREQLRVARRLTELPGIRASFARGRLSYSQVRALTRVATPATDGDLVGLARHATAAQLEVVVRAYRGVLDREIGDVQPEHQRRYVSCRHDDDGALLIQARLPAEEGALLLAALEAGRDSLRAGEPAEGASAETTHTGDTDERATVSNADAMVLMAETLLSTGPAHRNQGESYQVVVHVDAATLEKDEPGSSQLEEGSRLAPETVRRLACDASLVRILERDGKPLSVGRKTRTLPPALRRALRSRDRCCRFPGCSQRRFLHGHHIQHWAHGGTTDLSNLVQLCAHHHRLLHEGGYDIWKGENGELRFRRPDGRTVPSLPRRARGEGREVPRRNRRADIQIDPETCVPRWYGDRLALALVVDGLSDRDPRLNPALEASP
jgi:hypothetical protein